MARGVHCFAGMARTRKSETAVTVPSGSTYFARPWVDVAHVNACHRVDGRVRRAWRRGDSDPELWQIRASVSLDVVCYVRDTGWDGPCRWYVTRDLDASTILAEGPSLSDAVCAWYTR